MRTLPGLDRLASQVLVGQLVRRLTEAGVTDLLEATPARLAALLAGRRRLTDRELNRVTAHTDQSWTLWLLDAGADSADPAVVAAPLRAAMLDAADGDRRRAVEALAAEPSTPETARPAARPASRPRRRQPAA